MHSLSKYFENRIFYVLDATIEKEREIGLQKAFVSMFSTVIQGRNKHIDTSFRKNWALLCTARTYTSIKVKKGWG